MRIEKEKLFLVISSKRLQCLPVTLNLYFSRFPITDYEACFSLSRGNFDSQSFRRWRPPTIDQLCPSIDMCAVPLISSLFTVSLRSLSSCESLHGNLSTLAVRSQAFSFFAQKSPLKRQKIMHPSGLYFNGTFQFSSRRRFASNHRHKRPISMKRSAKDWVTARVAKVIVSD